MTLRQCPGCERPTDLEICGECSDAVEAAVRAARTKRKSEPVRWGDPLIRVCPSCGRPNDGFCPCDGEGSG